MLVFLYLRWLFDWLYSDTIPNPLILTETVWLIYLYNFYWYNLENLSIFIEKIAKALPNLKYLSMMNNRAAPSYFNGGTLSEYTDYRYFDKLSEV